jgi:hypothetical protein
MPGLFKQWFVPTESHKAKTPQIAAPAAGAAGGPAAGGPAGVAPGTSPDDFRKQQGAYYQNMLAGLGQGTETGQLPQGITDNIEKQASLIK